MLYFSSSNIYIYRDIYIYISRLYTLPRIWSSIRYLESGAVQGWVDCFTSEPRAMSMSKQTGPESLFLSQRNVDMLMAMDVPKLLQLGCIICCPHPKLAN